MRPVRCARPQLPPVGKRLPQDFDRKILANWLHRLDRPAKRRIGGFEDMIDFQAEPARHIPIIRLDQDMVSASEFDPPIGDFLVGADLKSLALFRRDRLFGAGNNPRPNRGIARHFVIGTPFIENFRRGMGAKKLRVQGLDQGERLDPREQRVRPRGAGRSHGGVGRNR